MPVYQSLSESSIGAAINAEKGKEVATLSFLRNLRIHQTLRARMSLGSMSRAPTTQEVGYRSIQFYHRENLTKYCSQKYSLSDRAQTVPKPPKIAPSNGCVHRRVTVSIERTIGRGHLPSAQGLPQQEARQKIVALIFCRRMLSRVGNPSLRPHSLPLEPCIAFRTTIPLLHAKLKQ
jgi:hypothetical protein